MSAARSSYRSLLRVIHTSPLFLLALSCLIRSDVPRIQGRQRNDQQGRGECPRTLRSKRIFSDLTSRIAIGITAISLFAFTVYHVGLPKGKGQEDRTGETRRSPRGGAVSEGLRRAIRTGERRTISYIDLMDIPVCVMSVVRSFSRDQIDGSTSGFHARRDEGTRG